MLMPSGFDWFGSLGGNTCVVFGFDEIRESYGTWVFTLDLRRV